MILVTPASPSAASATSASQPASDAAFTTTHHDCSILKSFSPDRLAQALVEQLAITPNDWHRLSSNRAVRAREQTAAALVYMLKDQPEEALPRLAQAIGWLDKTLSAPPCPTHHAKDESKRDSMRESKAIASESSSDSSN